MSKAHDTVKAMLDDPFVLAIVLHEIHDRFDVWAVHPTEPPMAYWTWSDPFLWTLASITGSLLGEVCKDANGTYTATVYADGSVDDGDDGVEFSSGPYGLLDEAKTFVVGYLTQEGELGPVFDSCPWG
jgi:hypothetical protein